MYKTVIVLILLVIVSCSDVDQNIDTHSNTDMDFISVRSESFFEDSYVENLIERLSTSNDTNLSITVDSIGFVAVYSDSIFVYSILIEDEIFIQEVMSTDGGYYYEEVVDKDSICLFLVWYSFLGF